jgi:two-component system sensor histidine kinase GlrK
VVEGDATLSHPVDPERLGMALGNLLSNAVRFSPPGGRIRWWVGTLNGQVVLEISDNGPGIPEGEREHIFDPFYRGHVQPLNLPRGSGIGLAIVREQVAAHGGQVRLVARADGACFQILLPLDTSHV